MIRSRRLIVLIGMIQPCENTADPSRLHTIGCAGRVTGFSETEDGRYMITLQGISRFRAVKEVSGFESYRRMDVSWDGFGRDLGTSESDPGFRRDSFLELLGRYFDTSGLSTDWDSLKEADSELLINSLSMLCPFPTPGTSKPCWRPLR